MDDGRGTSTQAASTILTNAVEDALPAVVEAIDDLSDDDGDAGDDHVRVGRCPRGGRAGPGRRQLPVPADPVDVESNRPPSSTGR